MNASENEDSDVEFVPLTPTSTSQNRLKLEGTALTRDRFGVSDRAAAAVASSVLQDVGLIADCSISNVIDKSKIRRKIINLRSSLQRKKIFDICGLYFDSLKDETLHVERIHEKKIP